MNKSTIMNMFKCTSHFKQKFPDLLIWYNISPQNFRLIDTNLTLISSLVLIYFLEIIIKIPFFTELTLYIKMTFLFPRFIKSYTMTSIFLPLVLAFNRLVIQLLCDFHKLIYFWQLLFSILESKILFFWFFYCI